MPGASGLDQPIALARALGSVVQAMGVLAAASQPHAALAAAIDLIAEGCQTRVHLSDDGADPAAAPQTVIRAAQSDHCLHLAVPQVPQPLAVALGVFVDTVARAVAQHASTCGELASVTAKLARRDTLLQSLFDMSPVGILLIEEDTAIIIEANAAFLGFGDWSREEVVGQDIFVLMPENDRHIPAEAVAQLANNSHFGPLEHVFQRPDGGVFPAVVRGVMLNTGTNKRVIWVLVEDVSRAQSDLSAIKVARDAAVRAREQLDTAIQALSHGFMLFDGEDRLVMVNDRIGMIYPEIAPFLRVGERYVDIISAAIADGMVPEAQGNPADYLKTVMAGRKQPVVDITLELASGRHIRVLDAATPNGGRVCLRMDVTAEQEAARRLNDVIAGSQAGTWEVDLITGENIVNDRWCEMLGVDRSISGEVTSHTWESLIHPDDRDQVLGSVARMIGGDIVHYEHTYRMRGGGGRWIWINDRGRISLRSADGKPLRMAGVHFDITALKEAEERLELIIAGAEAGTWQFDVQSGGDRINDQWAAMLGYTRAELDPLTRERWHDLVHPGDLAAMYRDQDARFARKEWVFTYELRLRHKAGHWVWVQSRGQVTRWDEHGVPTLMSGVHLDISARKLLEEQLKTERDFLSMLTETSVSGIMAVDAEARILFLNREAVSIFEAPLDQMIGQVCDPQVMGLVDHEGAAMVLADMPCRLAIAQNAIQRDTRLRLTTRDGRTKVVSVNAAPLPDTGLHARVVCTITDITASAQAEDDLRAAMDRAESANRAKSQFLANMSHELRTPLNGVLGMADLLAEGRAADYSAEQTRAMAQTIRESGGLLLSILNDILDLAKIESGKLTLADEVFALRGVTDRIDAMHGLAARAKAVALTLRLDPALGAMRRGDPQRLLQVLHNLVGNAVKFTEAGTVDVDITAQGDAVQIVVRDTGIGMTPAQVAVVFDEFTQADGSITRRFGGTGLGLPIVRRLVHLMGGQIVLDSALGQGSTVTVQLPLPAATGLSDAASDAAARPDFTGLRALVAEDNATNRMILRAMLGRLGISATLAKDGDEAVRCYAPGQFDLLLLDISMPIKDGLTALAEMRAKSAGTALPPALAVTANAMTHLVDSYRDGGFADVVTKPIQLDALAAAILRVCPMAVQAAD